LKIFCAAYPLLAVWGLKKTGIQDRRAAELPAKLAHLGTNLGTKHGETGVDRCDAAQQPGLEKVADLLK
jgi:hypothetical protein